MKKWFKYIRAGIQLAAFLLIPGLFVQVYIALQTVVTLLVQGEKCFGAYEQPICILAAVLPALILVGRYFCGFFCSFGAMQDLVYWIGKRFLRIRFRVSGKADTIGKFVKYVILLAGLVMAGSGIAGKWQGPWKVFGQYTSITYFPGLKPLFSIGGLLLLLIIAGSLFTERFFCRYLCPMGALYAILSRLHIGKLRKNPGKCGNCSLCTRQCSMGISLEGNSCAHSDAYPGDYPEKGDASEREVKICSGECIACHKCESNCPKKNMISTVPGMMYIGILVTVVGIVGGLWASEKCLEAASLSMSAENQSTANQDIENLSTANQNAAIQSTSCQNTAKTNDKIAASSQMKEEKLESEAGVSEINEEAVSDTQKSQASTNACGPASDGNEDNGTVTSSAGEFFDGIYQGSGEGYRGSTTVEVTVEGGRITDIQVTDYKDDKSYLVRAMNSVIPSILEKQDPQVDVVSGVTYSCNGIIDAVDNALEGKRQIDADGQKGDIGEKSSEKLYEETSLANESDKGSTGHDARTDKETLSDYGIGNKNESAEDKEVHRVPFADLIGDLPDGTYIGSAWSFRGDVEVEVTVKAKEITDIRLLSYYDTPEYLFLAAPYVIEGMLKEQSPEVDVVSGATYSSNGIIQATAKALQIPDGKYQLKEGRELATLHNKHGHVVQKRIESMEEYEELVKQYAHPLPMEK